MCSMADCALDSPNCNDSRSSDDSSKVIATAAVVAIGAYAFYKLFSKEREEQNSSLLSHNTKNKKEQNLILGFAPSTDENSSLDLTIQYKF